MKWGYIVDEKGRILSQLILSISSYSNFLLTGGSGSGKSWTLLYLLGCLLQDTPDIEVYLCDFKKSEEFMFLRKYKNYYSGNECYDGILNYYNSFCEVRESGKARRRCILICDEYPALINYLTMRDKIDKTKKANEVLGAVSELLMLGRGKGYSTWIVTQRAEASLFINGARDNFMITVGLGRMSKEQKGMIFPGEDIPNKIFRTGEGCILADGYPLQLVAYPRIKNMVDWKKHILNILMSNSD